MSDTMSHIRAILAATPLRWGQLAMALSEEQLRERPAPGEWSALECLQHMIDTERMAFPVRLEALRNGREISALGPEDFGDHPDDQSIAALVTTFAQLRAENLAVLAHVSAAEFGSGGLHTELGPVTVGELLHEWAAHDFDHTIQAERALMQPYIRGCGPWQPYFAANRIDPPAQP
jgi:DinB superfamily